jgi:hypothetical protein
MLIAVLSALTCSVQGTEEPLGAVNDLWVDGRTWSVRYLVIDTQGWLPKQRILVAPSLVEWIGWPARQLSVSLARDQVTESLPATERLKGRPSGAALPAHLLWTLPDDRATGKGTDDAEVFSVREMLDGPVRATDGRIGQVDDFILDDESWEEGKWLVRYLVVRMGEGMAGKRVLLSAARVKFIGGPDRIVEVDVIRETVEKSPQYDPTAPVNRRYEEVLYDYYGMPKYWSAAGSAEI